MLERGRAHARAATCASVLLVAVFGSLTTACIGSPSEAIQTEASPHATNAIAPSSPPPVRSPTPKPTPKPKRSPTPIVDPGNPVAPGFVPESVAFWNEDDGLLAGWVYRYKNSGQSDGAIAVTHDGGSSWHVSLKVPSPAREVSVAPDGAAFATVGARSPKIVVSRDQGASWAVLPGSKGLSQPAFITATDGWAVKGGGEQLVRLSAAGVRRVPDPCEPSVVDISFPANGGGRGWLACAGEPGAGNQPKEIYETNDGGASWEVRARCRPDKDPSKECTGGLGANGYLTGISFLPDGSGWLTEYRGTFYETSDGGLSWIPRLGFQAPEVAFGSGPWRVDDELGFVIEARPFGVVLNRTQDGGESWSRLATFPHL